MDGGAPSHHPTVTSDGRGQYTSHLAEPHTYTLLPDGPEGSNSQAQPSAPEQCTHPPIAEADYRDDERGVEARQGVIIKFIEEKTRRGITFSKRKRGIMKKVCPLH